MRIGQSLRTRVGLVFGLFALLFAVNSVAVLVLTESTTVRSTEALLADALRARSQRIAKDIITYSALPDGDAARATLIDAVDRFDETLVALIDGGEGRIASEIEPIAVPAASGNLATGLREVARLWAPLREAVHATLAAPPDSAEALAAAEPILTGNVELLRQLERVTIDAYSEFRATADLRTTVTLALALLAMALVAVGWRWLDRKSVV